MNAKWNLIVDVAQCCGCYNCALACKDEYSGNDLPGYFSSHPKQGKSALDIEYHERGQFPNVEAYYVPVMCNHCDNAPCMKADKDGVITKRDDGIVIFDPARAKGKEDLVAACPYGAIIWNEESETPQTWIFDAHLLDRGYEKPNSVEACPTGALIAVKCTDEQMVERATAENLTRLLEEKNTQARVYYRNYEKVTTCFISGSVRKEFKGVTECLKDASAIVIRGDEIVAQAQSDDFGDFRISGLEPNLGTCRLELRHQGAVTLSLPIEIGSESMDVGIHKL
ncbi:MAG: oxidoreductase [Rhodobacteraceae bacterium]|nr:oxidoreductase [Paracoccaceae bacterium]